MNNFNFTSTCITASFSLQNNQGYNDSYDDNQEKQHHGQGYDTFIKDKNTQTAMNCHPSPAIVSTMGDEAGDSVVLGCDCVKREPAIARIECVQF